MLSKSIECNGINSWSWKRKSSVFFFKITFNIHSNSSCEVYHSFIRGSTGSCQFIHIEASRMKNRMIDEIPSNPLSSRFWKHANRKLCYLFFHTRYNIFNQGKLDSSIDFRIHIIVSNHCIICIFSDTLNIGINSFIGYQSDKSIVSIIISKFLEMSGISIIFRWQEYSCGN